MTTKAQVSAFFAQKTLAVAGVSRDPKKFGYRVFQDLKEKGYTVYPINPNAESIAGERCYPNLAALPETPAGLVLVTPPAHSEELVRVAAALGIGHIWMQPGAESEAAVRFCHENGLACVVGECVFMYAEPAAWYHRAHRLINRLTGKAPQ